MSSSSHSCSKCESPKAYAKSQIYVRASRRSAPLSAGRCAITESACLCKSLALAARCPTRRISTTSTATKVRGSIYTGCLIIPYFALSFFRSSLFGKAIPITNLYLFALKCRTLKQRNIGINRKIHPGLYRNIFVGRLLIPLRVENQLSLNKLTTVPATSQF